MFGNVTIDLTRKERLVLSILNTREKMLGSEGEMMAKQIVDKSGKRLKLGGIYPLLNRIENKGWISSISDPGLEGRRVYNLTFKGGVIIKSYDTLLQQLSED